jgi:hypothetical protein
VLIEQDAQVPHSPLARECAVPAADLVAARLVGHLPADQALGLRLIAMARAAAAVHLAASATPDLRSSQAASLIRTMAHAREGLAS